MIDLVKDAPRNASDRAWRRHQATEHAPLPRWQTRFCHLGSARPIDEDPQIWECLSTEPVYGHHIENHSQAPAPSDDLYTLGLSM